MPKQAPETSHEREPDAREKIEKTLEMTDETIISHIESHPVCALLEYMHRNPQDKLVQNALSHARFTGKVLNACRTQNSSAKAIVQLWRSNHKKPIDEFMNKIAEKIPSADKMLEKIKQADIEFYLNKIKRLKDEGDYQRVIIVAKQGLEIYPNAEIFYIELAGAAEKSGDEAGALKAWQEALKLNPDNGWYKACIKNCEEGLGIAEKEPSEDTESTKGLPPNILQKLEQMSLEQVASYVRKTINTTDDLQYKTAITKPEGEQLATYLLLLPLLQEYYEERKGSEIEDEDTKDQTDEEPADEESTEEQTDDQQDQSQEEEEHVRFTDVLPPRFQTLDPVALSAMDLKDLDETITDVAERIESLIANLESDEEESEELKNLVADFRELKKYRKERLEEWESNGEEEPAPNDDDIEKDREDTSEFESKKVHELLERGDRVEIWRAIESFKGAIEFREIIKDGSSLDPLKLGLARLEVFYVKEFGTLIPPKDSITPPFGKQPDLVDKKPEDTFPEGELPPLPESKEDGPDALLDEMERLSTPPEPTDTGTVLDKLGERMENGDGLAQGDGASKEAEISHIALPELHTSYKSMLTLDSPNESFERIIEALKMDTDLTLKLSRDMKEGQEKEEVDRKIWQNNEDVRRIKRYLAEKQRVEELNQEGAIPFRPSSIPGVEPSVDPTNGGTISEAPDLDILGDQPQEEAIPLPSPFAGVDLSPEEDDESTEEEPVEEDEPPLSGAPSEDTETDEDDGKSVDDEMIIPFCPTEPTATLPSVFAPLTIREGEHIEIGVLTSNRKGNRLITVEKGAGITVGQGLPGAQIKVSEESYYKIIRGDNWSIKNGLITFS